jgi:hypothetical protein
MTTASSGTVGKSAIDGRQLSPSTSLFVGCTPTTGIVLTNIFLTTAALRIDGPIITLDRGSTRLLTGRNWALISIGLLSFLEVVLEI